MDDESSVPTGPVTNSISKDQNLTVKGFCHHVSEMTPLR